jgi:hypothetical protein
MSRYFAPGFLVLAVFIPSHAFALTCTPPQVKVCHGSICNCYGFSTYVGPDGKTVIQLQVPQEDGPKVLKRLGIDPKVLKQNSQ